MFVFFYIILILVPLALFVVVFPIVLFLGPFCQQLTMWVDRTRLHNPVNRSVFVLSCQQFVNSLSAACYVGGPPASQSFSVRFIMSTACYVGGPNSSQSFSVRLSTACYVGGPHSSQSFSVRLSTACYVGGPPASQSFSVRFSTACYVGGPPASQSFSFGFVMSTACYVGGPPASQSFSVCFVMSTACYVAGPPASQWLNGWTTHVNSLLRGWTGCRSTKEVNPLMFVGQQVASWVDRTWPHRSV